jgi:hypothetical protein
MHASEVERESGFVVWDDGENALGGHETTVSFIQSENVKASGETNRDVTA